MAQVSTMWDRMTPDERLRAAGIDIMNHPQFGLLAGFVVMGKVQFAPGFPTAATNGIDEYYGPEFMAKQNRKQTRFIRIHENFHKALRHCSDYKDVCTKHPQESNMAMDYVINGFIYEADPQRAFIEDPAEVEPLYDAKYKGMGFIEVLQDLLKNPPKSKASKPGKPGQPGQPGSGGTGGMPQPMDQHIPLPDEVDAAKHAQRVEDAARQGRMVVEKMAGKGRGGAALDGVVQERRTNWRDAMREFVATIIEGDDMSRFCPPNKRLQPLGFLMPSHFSETTGQLVIACDTSGSMGGVYPVVFGEVARIVQTVTPESVRILWWDTEVAGDQTFKPHEYPQIAQALKPAGGGGTSPGAVVAYMKQHRITPKAVIWLTDGYLDGSEADPGCPQLWGIVDRTDFVPAKGKVIHISSARL